MHGKNREEKPQYERVREKIIKIKTTTSAEAAAATTTTETNQQGKVAAESALLCTNTWIETSIRNTTTTAGRWSSARGELKIK